MKFYNIDKYRWMRSSGYTRFTKIVENKYQCIIISHASISTDKGYGATECYHHLQDQSSVETTSYAKSTREIRFLIYKNKS